MLSPFPTIAAPPPPLAQVSRRNERGGGRRRASNSSNEQAATPPHEPLIVEVRDRHPIRLEFPPRDSRVRKRRPSSSIAIPRARIAFGVVARASPPLSSSLVARPALTPPSARRPPPDRLAQVHAGETVRELCDRVLVNPFDPSSRGASNLPEVTWANTLIPLEEQIDQLTVTKPWQLNLKGGEEVLTMTVPSGVGVRDAPEPPEERATPEEARSKSSRGAEEEEAGEKSALEGKKFTIRDVRGTSSDEASPEEKARLAAAKAEREEQVNAATKVQALHRGNLSRQNTGVVGKKGETSFSDSLAEYMTKISDWWKNDVVEGKTMTKVRGLPCLAVRSQDN